MRFRARGLKAKSMQRQRDLETSTLIRHENEIFRKRSVSNLRNLKMPSFRQLRVGGNNFETGVSENDSITIIIWFPYPS